MISMKSRAVLVAMGAAWSAACSDDAPGGDALGGTDGETTEDVSTFGSSDSEAGETETGTTETGTTETETESGETEAGTTETETESGETETESGETETESGETETGTTETAETGMANQAPFVISTSPAEAEEAVVADTTIEVVFSEAMNSMTVTTNTDGSCSGSVQVSADDFATCVAMTAQPGTFDDQTFSVVPAAAMDSATAYAIRVLGTASDSEGLGMDGDFLGEAFVVRYFHTIVIDGVNDFTEDETFESSTVGHTGYVAWDTDYLYLGMNSPDLAGGDGQTWLVAYLGGSPGSNSGVLYNTQQPAMAFDARWHLRWKASGDFGGALEFGGGSWSEAGFGPAAGSEDVEASASFVELRVAWSELDSPDSLGLHMGMLREQAFNESSWAAVPESSHVDGYDPDYGMYIDFEVTGSIQPSDFDPS